MNLQFNTSLAASYTSNSQIARILTENWVKDTIFCPVCGNPCINQEVNNTPVGDFYCPACHGKFELKSKKREFCSVVPDGAYNTMLDKILTQTNPHFFFLHYSPQSYAVVDFFFVPRYFFIPQIIKKRAPLRSTARRAGWTGCNICLNEIPASGKIFLIQNSTPVAKHLILEKVKQTLFFDTANIQKRSWLADILFCIEKLGQDTFTLSQLYAFEPLLKERHPENNNIQAKIRQQLQILRDKSLLAFMKRGVYKKIFVTPLG